MNNREIKELLSSPAAALIRHRPELTLRQIASEIGVSLSYVKLVYSVITPPNTYTK